MTSDVSVSGDVPAEDPARILIVDDLKSSRLLIGGLLKRAGYSNFAFAADGVEAVEALAREPFDMMILDIVMPRKDGFDVCREARGELKLDIPILIQSALQDADQRASAFDAGASDVVSKPIHAKELICRVRLHLEGRRMVRRLRRYQERMEEELQAAESMQISLLMPDDEVAVIASPRGARVTTYYQASNQLGGDLWQIFPIDDDRFGIFLVDLSGHGVAAAINAFRVHMVADALQENRDAPRKWLASVNKHLFQMLPVEHFATAFYGVVDIAAGRITYASAGAPPPLHLKADGSWAELHGDGLILGVSRDAEYPDVCAELGVGDRLLLYSDALYENFDDPDQSLQGEDLARLSREVLAKTDGAGFHSELVARVFPDEDASRQDDLTLMLLEVRGDG